MELEPGIVHADHAAWQDRPIAVVGEPAAVLGYLAAAPIGPYVVVRERAHLPEGVALGGLVLLGAEPLADDLRDALVQACLLTDDVL